MKMLMNEFNLVLLLMFAEPTQIYRFLRTRNLISVSGRRLAIAPCWLAGWTLTCSSSFSPCSCTGL